jgi:hypothetical protein
MVFKVISTAIAAGAVAIGSYTYNQYHAVYVELNQAQQELRAEQAKNADLTTAAANVVTAVSNLEEVLKRDADTPAERAPLATAGLAAVESPEPSLASARASGE